MKIAIFFSAQKFVSHFLTIDIPSGNPFSSIFRKFFVYITLYYDLKYKDRLL